MNNIFTQLLYQMEKKQDTVLAVIVENSGSTPRESGSMMLVNKDGLCKGTIGGGGIEYHSILISRKLIEEKACGKHDFILRKNDIEDIGMGCGGDATVYFQYIPFDSEKWAGIASELLRRTSNRIPGYLIFDLDKEDGYLSDSYDCSMGNVFAMQLPLGERCIIFGGGHCAMALAPVLHSVGFRVTVFDNRSDMVDPTRYPMAEKLICGDYTRITDYLTFDKNDYIVIMTNGHEFDYEIQDQILDQPYAYAGCIGSKTKIPAVTARLKAAGHTDEQIATLHKPIGLTIKANTPEEIAVSISAELILERALLREKTGNLVISCPMR